MAINLRAPLLLAQALARQLPADQTGLVVNLLDQKLFNLNPDFLTYTLSKVGLQGLTTVLAQAFAPRLRVAHAVDRANRWIRSVEGRRA